jgi:hypothetical protein
VLKASERSFQSRTEQSEGGGVATEHINVRVVTEWATLNFLSIIEYIGEVPERSNGPPWKGGISETVSRVRIPPSPQKNRRFFKERASQLLGSRGWIRRGSPLFSRSFASRKSETCTEAVSFESLPSLSVANIVSEGGERVNCFTRARDSKPD